MPRKRTTELLIGVLVVWHIYQAERARLVTSAATKAGEKLRSLWPL